MAGPFTSHKSIEFSIARPNRLNENHEMPETPEQTALKMSRVRASGSKIECALGRALWKAGIRYRKQYRILGTPDFAIVSLRVAVFCDSNFWHGYRWGARFKTALKKNRTFWINKIEANRRRDRRINRQLRAAGWTVIRFWEHQIRDAEQECVRKVIWAVNASRSG